MRKSFSTAVSVLLLTFAATQSFGYEEYRHHRPRVDEDVDTGTGTNNPSPMDRELANACASHRGINFVEARNLRVTKVLPDDTSGNKHQRWMLQLSNGQALLAVFNIDEWKRVPLKTGDIVDVGGQFIWTDRGCLIHWLHEDPEGHRPDGYVVLNGVTYGVAK